MVLQQRHFRTIVARLNDKFCHNSREAMINLQEGLPAKESWKKDIKFLQETLASPG